MNRWICTLALLLFFSSASSQQAQDWEGLWVIQKVQFGDQEMTPDARWTRLNADGTQESGNGWFQHSYGNWVYEEDAGLITVVNVNGPEDEFGGFRVALSGDRAVWTRDEEGAQVKVFLERSRTLPATLRDRVIGLWKLKQMVGNGPILEEGKQGAEAVHLFIRWDGKFVVHIGSDRIFGVYNVHAHKPELELIPYGNKERTWWIIELGDSLSLELLNSDEKVTRQFYRVRNYDE